MGRTADYSRQSCSIAATLEVIGDPWTLLVIRDAFNGVSRFEQWQDNLGVARNVLAARAILWRNGVLVEREVVGGNDARTVSMRIGDGVTRIGSGPGAEEF